MMEKSEFHVLIKHCFLMWKNAVQAKQWLNKCYLDFGLLETMVKRWHADFKHGHTDTNDAECSGQPNSEVVPENTKKLHKLVLADRKLKLREIAEKLKISEDSVFTIFHEKAMFKVGAAFTHSRSKATMHRRFRAFFATVSTQQNGVFA